MTSCQKDNLNCNLQKKTKQKENERLTVEDSKSANYWLQYSRAGFHQRGVPLKPGYLIGQWGFGIAEHLQGVA